MTRDTLSKKIEKVQSEIIDGNVRDYIGASSIGADCLRQIWYEYKGTIAEKVPAKTRRTWMIGKHLEELVLDWLEISGIKIARVWYDLVSKRVPFFKGHLDSVWMKKEEAYAIIEIKTAKDASFTTFVNKGLKKWNPQYYAQIQSYMGMSKIFNAYILVLNKDNSDISDEFVLFDEIFYKGLEDKAIMIGEAQTPPPRINGSPIWYQCKMCKFHKVCHT